MDKYSFIDLILLIIFWCVWKEPITIVLWYWRFGDYFRFPSSLHYISNYVCSSGIISANQQSQPSWTKRLSRSGFHNWNSAKSKYQQQWGNENELLSKDCPAIRYSPFAICHSLIIGIHGNNSLFVAHFWGMCLA